VETNRFVTVNKPESLLITSFDVSALLALTEQESLAKESSTKEEEKK
jgi:hypothetical protein